jgi:hypothetical protein
VTRANEHLYDPALGDADSLEGKAETKYLRLQTG